MVGAIPTMVVMYNTGWMSTGRKNGLVRTHTLGCDRHNVRTPANGYIEREKKNLRQEKKRRKKTNTTPKNNTSTYRLGFSFPFCGCPFSPSVSFCLFVLSFYVCFFLYRRIPFFLLWLPCSPLLGGGFYSSVSALQPPRAPCERASLRIPLVCRLLSCVLAFYLFYFSSLPSFPFSAFDLDVVCFIPGSVFSLVGIIRLRGFGLCCNSFSVWYESDTYILVGLVPCYLVCRLLPALVNIRGFPTTFLRSLPIPLDATRNGCVALPTQFGLILVAPDHEPFGCFEDSEVPLARLLCLRGPRRDLNSTHQRGVFRGPLCGSNHLD